jgi:cbb3-type cytochrome oxidase maturation protein
MGVIYVVLPLALLVVLAAVLAFVWAARSGQFDDTTTPAMRPLIEEDSTPPVASEAKRDDEAADTTSPQ